MPMPKSYYKVEFKHDDESFMMTWFVPDEYASDDEEAEIVAIDMAEHSEVPNWTWKHADDIEVTHHGSY